MATYKPGARLKCLNCQTVVLFETPEFDLDQLRDGVVVYQSVGTKVLYVIGAYCPNCSLYTITVMEVKPMEDGGHKLISEKVIWPLSSGRSPAPEEVPQSIADDYNEACLVLPYSPKASAALSRRCLQTVLHDAGKTKSKDLAAQIVEVLKQLPSYIAVNLDAVRQIGNFAAHEQKSINTGAILDVEPGEAEWNLEVLEALFDFFYVKPSLEQKKRDELNIKLQAAGKPLLKQL